VTHRSSAALVVAIAALAIPASASAATKTVYAGPPLAKPPKGVPQYASANEFFRKNVTIHTGDSVSWRFRGFHNITIPKKGTAPPPLASADPTRKDTGETDPAGAPFWFEGQAQFILDPLSAFPQGGKTYTGNQLVTSGLPAGEGEPKPFKVKFTKPGSYTYYCTVHAGMKGKVNVVGRRRAIPTAKADKRAIAAQLARDIAEVKKNDKRADAAGAVVELGRDTSRTALIHIFPTTKTVPVGTAVEFRMSAGTGEIHTASFFAAKDLVKGGYAEKLARSLGAPLPGTGQGGPPVLGFPGAIVYPSQPGELTYDGTQNGGFVSTGILDGDAKSPIPQSRKITFTAPGTFSYICLIHPEMKATLTVQ
jgi:plastocyanin